MNNYDIYKGLSINYKYDTSNKENNIKNHIAYMINRCHQMFRLNNLPETMPEREIKRMLITNGNIFVTEHQNELYGFVGAPGGVPNAYYMPTEYIVANPYLNISKAYKIGIDGVLIRNDSLMRGLLPLISKYSTQLVENELTLYNVEILTRAMLVFTADKDNDIPEIKNYLKSLQDGKMAAIGTEKILSKNGTVEVQPGSQASPNIIRSLIELEQYLKGSMWNELGLNSNWNAKHENITSSENMLNDDALLPLYDDMLDNWQEGFDEVNKMFGTNITVERNSSWEDNEIEKEALEDQLENQNEIEDYKEEVNQNGEKPDIRIS